MSSCLYVLSKIFKCVISYAIIRLELHARRTIDAFAESSSEEIHSHNREYQPEYQTDHEHVKDGRYGSYQGIHYNLSRMKE